MKVLWFCNAIITESQITGTGTWLVAMAHALAQSNEIHIYSITSGNTRKGGKVHCKGIQQWVLPNVKRRNNGLPSTKIIKNIQQIVNEIDPDIIHIWGTEGYWGLLTARGYLKGTTIVDIQGLVSQIQKYVYYGLTTIDIMRCFGIKEIMKPSASLLALKHRFNKLADFEIEIIKKHKNISTQSDWTRAHVYYCNPEAQVFSTKIALRAEFLACAQWDYSKCDDFTIFTVSADSLSFKGLHVLIDAIALLKPFFPRMKLNIAGYIAKGIRQSGYTRFIKAKIRKLGIEEMVYWVGALNAKELIKYILKTHVVVIPSFIESYCVFFHEALTVGVPCVVSFSGAMPEFAVHNQSALFFPPGDSEMLARCIVRIFESHRLAQRLSDNSYLDKQKCLHKDIIQNQLEIYKRVVRANKQ
jgi:glycosyltransferase involved in cell wall biosynthesis